jgi:hypothetical protein
VRAGGLAFIPHQPCVGETRGYWAVGPIMPERSPLGRLEKHCGPKRHFCDVKSQWRSVIMDLVSSASVMRRRSALPGCSVSGHTASPRPIVRCALGHSFLPIPAASSQVAGKAFGDGRALNRIHRGDCNRLFPVPTSLNQSTTANGVKNG